MANSTLTNEQFLKRLKDNNIPYKPLQPYKGIYEKIDFECEQNHIFHTTPNNILHTGSCPYCSNRKVLIGYNDLWTTRPDIACLLKEENDGYRVKNHQKIKLTFVCPICKKDNIKDLHNVCSRGFSCKYCSDGVSYPNKFIRELFINQLNVDNLDFEYSPDWAKHKLYDCYFEINCRKYIVEMDGGLGHGNNTFGTNVTDLYGIGNDLMKDTMAYEHNINVIRIDSNYITIEGRFEFIKNNILNSELNNLFDLTNVNWDECNKFAISSYVEDVAILYNNGFTCEEIQNKLKSSHSSVYKWLQLATELGLCEYSRTEMISRSRKKMMAPVLQFTKDKMKFIQEFESISEAAKSVGVSTTQIIKCCKGRGKSAAGYYWEYKVA